MKFVRKMLFWVIGVCFIIIGVLKALNLDTMSEAVFNRAHYPRWFFYAVALVELAAGVLLLMTANASKRIGSLLIALIMLGALGTRILLDQPLKNLIIPGVIFLIAMTMSIRLGRDDN